MYKDKIKFLMKIISIHTWYLSGKIHVHENNSTNAVKRKINLSTNYLIQLLYNIIQNNILFYTNI